MTLLTDADKLKKLLGDKYWRLNNLYFIKDKNGRKIKFKMNWAQERLYKDMHTFNVILKARQLGFTTFINLYLLDSCIFNKDHSAGIIAHTKHDAEELFDDKAKFAYDNLPDWVKNCITTESDNAKRLKLSNGSRMYVGTSLRSGTLQKLLISEYGKVSAKYPEKAKEIKTGALNTIAAGQQIFVESTAEGKSGEFYDLCQTAIKLRDSGKELSNLEPKIHFFAWFDNPDYCLPDDEAKKVVIPIQVDDYLNQFSLSQGQKAWYAAKALIMGEDMKQEYPSTIEEAFQGSAEGAFYKDEMKTLRERSQITSVMYDSRYPVYTFWDLGRGADKMSIWFAQFIDNRARFIDYHESSNNGWDYYASMLSQKGYNYATHFFPHDGNTKVAGKEMYTTKEVAQQVGIRPIKIVPRTKSVYDDIMNHCRPALTMCVYDSSRCALGLQHLDNYRRKWDKSTAVWMKEAVHDDSSHGADAFRTYAMADSHGLIFEKEKKKVSMRRGAKSFMA